VCVRGQVCLHNTWTGPFVQVRSWHRVTPTGTGPVHQQHPAFHIKQCTSEEGTRPPATLTGEGGGDDYVECAGEVGAYRNSQEVEGSPQGAHALRHLREEHLKHAWSEVGVGAFVRGTLQTRRG
jgi:hypothetical protein